MLISKFALRIPVGSEVDQRVGILVLEEMLVELLEASKAAKVGVRESGSEA